MSSIDIVILGIIFQEPMSAYDIQKALSFRKIDKWVKISIPSIYKKVISLEKQGFLCYDSITDKKSIYSITDAGEKYYFQKIDVLMHQEINIFLDFNSIIAGFDNISLNEQKHILLNIQKKILERQLLIEQQIKIKTQFQIPVHGIQLLGQQEMLIDSLLDWVNQYLESY